MNHTRTIIFAVVIIGGLFSLYFGYSKYFLHVNSQDIILSEDRGEYKRRPVDPGGIIIPHSNSLIYEKLNRGSVVENSINLLSDPEEPIDLGFRSNLESVVVYDSIDDILAKLDLDGEDKIAQNESSSSQEITDAIPAPVNPNIATDEIHGSEQNADQIEVSKLKFTKLTEETNKLHSFNINSIDSGYKIQLSSAWSEKEAKSEWQKIQVRHAKHLKNAQLIIKKVKINNDRIIYLIMAGSYSSLNQAKLTCKKLVASKQNCIVTK